MRCLTGASILILSDSVTRGKPFACSCFWSPWEPCLSSVRDDLKQWVDGSTEKVVGDLLFSRNCFAPNTRSNMCDRSTRLHDLKRVLRAGIEPKHPTIQSHAYSHGPAHLPRTALRNSHADKRIERSSLLSSL
jgi:hypothetical protein